MDTQKATREYRLAQWTSIVRDCRSSGMTVTSWCESHKVNIKSYYYWQKKVRQAACLPLSEKSDGCPVNLVSLSRQSGNISTLGMPAIPGRFSADAILHFGQVQLEISNYTDMKLLSFLIKELSHV